MTIGVSHFGFPSNLKWQGMSPKKCLQVDFKLDSVWGNVGFEGNLLGLKEFIIQ